MRSQEADSCSKLYTITYPKRGEKKEKQQVRNECHLKTILYFLNQFAAFLIRYKDVEPEIALLFFSLIIKTNKLVRRVSCVCYACSRLM